MQKEIREPPKWIKTAREELDKARFIAGVIPFVDRLDETTRFINRLRVRLRVKKEDGVTYPYVERVRLSGTLPTKTADLLLAIKHFDNDMVLGGSGTELTELEGMLAYKIGSEMRGSDLTFTGNAGLVMAGIVSFMERWRSRAAESIGTVIKQATIADSVMFPDERIEHSFNMAQTVEEMKCV